MCSFITPTPRKRLIAPANITRSSMGLARASSMDLRNSSLRRRTNSKREFRNIEIRQDGPLRLVTLNYDFVINDKVHHSGLEVWQVCKIDGQWKILSVAWTIY